MTLAEKIVALPDERIAKLVVMLAESRTARRVGYRPFSAEVRKTLADLRQTIRSMENKHEA